MENPKKVMRPNDSKGDNSFRDRKRAKVKGEPMLRESWHQDKVFNSGARRGGGGGGEGWDSRYSTEFSAGFSGREPPPFSRSVSDSLGSGERGDMVYANRGWPPTRRASSDDCYGGRSSSSPSGYPRGAAGGTAAAGGGAVSAGMGAPAGPGSGRRHSGASSHPVYPAAEAYMRGPPRSGYYHGAAPGSAEGGYDAAGYGDFWGGYRDRGYHNHYNHQDYLYSSKYEYSSFHTSGAGFGSSSSRKGPSTEYPSRFASVSAPAASDANPTGYSSRGGGVGSGGRHSFGYSYTSNIASASSPDFSYRFGRFGGIGGGGGGRFGGHGFGRSQFGRFANNFKSPLSKSPAAGSSRFNRNGADRKSSFIQRSPLKAKAKDSTKDKESRKVEPEKPQILIDNAVKQHLGLRIAHLDMRLMCALLRLDLSPDLDSRRKLECDNPIIATMRKNDGKSNTAAVQKGDGSEDSAAVPSSAAAPTAPPIPAPPPPSPPASAAPAAPLPPGAPPSSASHSSSGTQRQHQHQHQRRQHQQQQQQSDRKNEETKDSASQQPTHDVAQSMLLSADRSHHSQFPKSQSQTNSGASRPGRSKLDNSGDAAKTLFGASTPAGLSERENSGRFKSDTHHNRRGGSSDRSNKPLEPDASRSPAEHMAAESIDGNGRGKRSVPLSGEIVSKPSVGLVKVASMAGGGNVGDEGITRDHQEDASRGRGGSRPRVGNTADDSSSNRKRGRSRSKSSGRESSRPRRSRSQHDSFERSDRGGSRDRDRYASQPGGYDDAYSAGRGGVDRSRDRDPYITTDGRRGRSPDLYYASQDQALDAYYAMHDRSVDAYYAGYADHPYYSEGGYYPPAPVKDFRGADPGARMDGRVSGWMEHGVRGSRYASRDSRERYHPHHLQDHRFARRSGDGDDGGNGDAVGGSEGGSGSSSRYRHQREQQQHQQHWHEHSVRSAQCTANPTGRSPRDKNDDLRGSKESTGSKAQQQEHQKHLPQIRSGPAHSSSLPHQERAFDDSDQTAARRESSGPVDSKEQKREQKLPVEMSSQTTAAPIPTPSAVPAAVQGQKRPRPAVGRALLPVEEQGEEGEVEDGEASAGEADIDTGADANRKPSRSHRTVTHSGTGSAHMHHQQKHQQQSYNQHHQHEQQYQQQHGHAQQKSRHQQQYQQQFQYQHQQPRYASYNQQQNHQQQQRQQQHVPHGSSKGTGKSPVRKKGKGGSGSVLALTAPGTPAVTPSATTPALRTPR